MERTKKLRERQAASLKRSLQLQRLIRKSPVNSWIDDPTGMPYRAWRDVTDPVSFVVRCCLQIRRQHGWMRLSYFSLALFVAAPVCVFPLMTVLFPTFDVGRPFVYALTIFVGGAITLVPGQVESIDGAAAERRARVRLWRIEIGVMWISIVGLVALGLTHTSGSTVRALLWAAGGTSVSDYLVLSACANLEAGRWAYENRGAATAHPPVAEDATNVQP